ncbi:MarR family winged helix-turn-helix transcriptional regulator [Paenibacillus abyssi]|uniref:Transcriptional regulator n=2 Tax=Paenibacillus abyssi TaxID=1340531 RepID=A0A917CQ74_9BACL|nr:MarR family transcriptional regulator [Paenibacillus abyssi]GGF92731.1 transcriptional regulator [Paenibacillus abyssi]
MADKEQQEDHDKQEEQGKHEHTTAQQLLQSFVQFRKVNWRQHTIEGCRHSDIMLMLMIKRNRKPDSSGMMVSEISSRLKVTKPTITQQIKNLEAEGLVGRTIDPADRRVYRIHLTEKGERITQRFEDEILDSFNGLIGYLGEEDSKQLVELLTRAYQYFKKQHEEQE